MTMTMSLASSPASSPVISLSRKTAEDVAQELIDISTRFESWNDPLSNQLHLFVGTTLQKARSYSRTGADLYPIVQERIAKLRSILVGADKAPLRDPILVQGRTWERWVYDEYSNRCSVMPEESKPHTYAIEINAWIERTMRFLPRTEVAPPSTNRQLTPALFRSSDPALAQLVLQQLMEKEALMQIVKEMQVWMELQAGILEETRQEMIILSESALKIAQERAEGHEEALKKQLADIQMIHAKTVAELETEKAWRAVETEKKITELEQRANALDQQRVQERQAIAAQVEAIKQSQLNQERALSVQLNSLKQTHSSIVNQLMGSMSAVHSQCAVLQNEVCDAQSRVQASEGRALGLSQQVNHLQGQVEAANARVEVIQEEAYAAIRRAKKNKCVIQ